MASSRFIAISKIALFLVCLLPLARLIYLGSIDALSANPVQFVEHSTGWWSLVMLVVTLCVTPIRNLFSMSWIVQYRRMLGLFMYFYACLHILIYAWIDHSLDWSEIIKDIYKHPYVIVGFITFIFSTMLAITSNQWMIKKLKRNWKKLHQLVYFISILGVLHFWWLVKRDVTEPLIFAIIISILLAYRIIKFNIEKSTYIQNNRIKT